LDHFLEQFSQDQIPMLDSLKLQLVEYTAQHQSLLFWLGENIATNLGQWRIHTFSPFLEQH
jgi:hypothetical protein